MLRLFEIVGRICMILLGRIDIIGVIGVVVDEIECIISAKCDMLWIAFATIGILQIETDMIDFIDDITFIVEIVIFQLIDNRMNGVAMIGWR